MLKADRFNYLNIDILLERSTFAGSGPNSPLIDMGTTARWWFRGVAAVLAVLIVGLLAESALAGPTAVGDGFGTPTDVAPSSQGAEPTAEPQSPTSDSRAWTVVTTQGFYTGTHPGARDVADLLAFDADGRVVYQNSTYDVYFDVDPVPGTRSTVEYVAAKRLGGDDCTQDTCSLNLVVRLNLSTGNVTRVYAVVTPQYDTGRWHDVDRVNETHLVVADIVFDRVYMVDFRPDEIVWQWSASEEYHITAGGGPGDWTHVNDVEVLEDGRIMVSLRNLDSVVFLEPGRGLIETWTLGADDTHDVLFEQHNPDYLPPERGGPAVLVTDSENNRVEEHRRLDGDWVLSWAWRDRALQWPRDADRLPNGHTLIADTLGDRIVEIDTEGSVVWQVEVGRPYDVERLGTGDESAGGWAAGSVVEAAPPAENQGPVNGGVVLFFKDLLPGPLVNGLLFVSPPWFGFTDLLLSARLLLDLALLGLLEWHWSDLSIRGWLRRIGCGFTRRL